MIKVWKVRYTNTYFLKNAHNDNPLTFIQPGKSEISSPLTLGLWGKWTRQIYAFHKICNICTWWLQTDNTQAHMGTSLTVRKSFCEKSLNVISQCSFVKSFVCIVGIFQTLRVIFCLQWVWTFYSTNNRPCSSLWIADMSKIEQWKTTKKDFTKCCCKIKIWSHVALTLFRIIVLKPWHENET